MGYTWFSKATIFTTEPQVIKKLIEEANVSNICYPRASDLIIEGNTISFHSSGYGYYGIRMCWDEEDMPLLFEYLFDNYDGALVCHEVVNSCQGEAYCFSTSWVKYERKIDWSKDEETYDIYTSTTAKTFDDLDDDFDAIHVWHIAIDAEDTPPAIKELINIAIEKGFTDWPEESEFWNSDVLTFEVIENLYEYLGSEYVDLIDSALAEAEQQMIESEDYIYSNIEFPAEFAELVENHNK